MIVGAGSSYPSLQPGIHTNYSPSHDTWVPMMAWLAWLGAEMSVSGDTACQSCLSPITALKGLIWFRSLIVPIYPELPSAPISGHCLPSLSPMSWGHMSTQIHIHSPSSLPSSQPLDWVLKQVLKTDCCWPGLSYRDHKANTQTQHCIQ